MAWCKDINILILAWGRSNMDSMAELVFAFSLKKKTKMNYFRDIFFGVTYIKRCSMKMGGKGKLVFGFCNRGQR